LLKPAVFALFVISLSTASQYYAIVWTHRIFSSSRKAVPFVRSTRLLSIVLLINAGLLAVTVLGWGFQDPDSPFRHYLNIGYFSVIVCIIWYSAVLLFFSTISAIAFRNKKPGAPVATRGDSAFRGEESALRVGQGGKGKDSGEEEGKLNPRAPISMGAEPVHSEDLTEAPAMPLSRRRFLKGAGMMGAASALGFCIVGLSEGYGPISLEEYDVYHPSLTGLDTTLRIIQTSDLHYGWFFGPDQLRSLVDVLNLVQGDALVITGDVFHSPQTAVEKAVPLLARLKPRSLGNFVCMGNHEYHVGASRSIKAFEKANMSLLANDWVTLRKEGSAIHLGGLDDVQKEWNFKKHWDTVRDFVGQAPEEPGMRLMLCHRPSAFPLIARAGIDLALTGHIHGGQMIAPIPGTDYEIAPAKLKSNYTHGWYKRRKCRMYLNRGAGLNYTPWRINCPPEISVFNLRHGEDYAVTARSGRVRTTI
jgi:uncharacterized protein